MITSKPCKWRVLATHNLEEVQGRIDCFVHLLRMSAVLAGLADKLFTRPDEFVPIQRYATHF